MTHQLDVPAIGRSFLFVPGDRPDRFRKAVGSRADGVIIDLEDAVPSTAKDDARTAAATFAVTVPVLVRVNAAGTSEHAADVRALVGRPALAGVVVPKAEDPRVMHRINSALGVPVVALVETARGLSAAGEIARTTGVGRLALGNLDLCLDLGILPGRDPDETALAYPRSVLAVASAAAGLAGPIDGVCPDVHDLSGLQRSAARAAALGMGAKLCLHPGQVPTVNAVFEVPEDLLAWAQAVSSAGRRSGGGVATVNGEMVDRPPFELADRILRQTPDPSV
jgi:citrate lyase beta subunit